jgi:hypothetical protein
MTRKLLILLLASCAIAVAADEIDATDESSVLADALKDLKTDYDDADRHKPLIRVPTQPQEQGNDSIAAALDDASPSEDILDLVDDGSMRTWGGGSLKASTEKVIEAPSGPDKNASVSTAEGKDDDKEQQRSWGFEEMNAVDDVSPQNDLHETNASSKESKKRMWGASSGENATKSSVDAAVHPSSELPASEKTRTIPFAKAVRREGHTQPPPDGFVIKARVYIDQADKLAHLSTDLPHIPYWDCGVTGSE